MRNEDVLLVDGQVVARMRAKLSTDARYVAGLFNGQRTLGDVMIASVLPGPRTLSGLRELCKGEALLAVKVPPSPPPSAPQPGRISRWGARNHAAMAMARTEPRPAAAPFCADEIETWERVTAPPEVRPATLAYHESNTGRFRSSKG